MSIYFEKARELGTLLLGSEQGLRLNDARTAFENNPQAVEMFENYKKYQADINESMQKGVLNEEQYNRLMQNAAVMVDDLKKHPIIGELVKTENEFYAFVNQVLGIVKATLTGDIDEGQSKCGGCHKKNCGSCGSAELS